MIPIVWHVVWGHKKNKQMVRIKNIFDSPIQIVD